MSSTDELVTLLEREVRGLVRDTPAGRYEVEYVGRDGSITVERLEATDEEDALGEAAERLGLR